MAFLVPSGSPFARSACDGSRRTILVPHFDHAILIAKTAASTRVSTFSRYERLLVADCSDTGARSNLESLACEYLKILDRDGIKTPSRWRNIGPR